MGAKHIFTETLDPDGNLVWRFENSKEYLSVTLTRIVSDSEHKLVLEDSGLERDGTEKQLSVWLSKNLHVLGEGMQLVAREYNTLDGAVDLLCHDNDGYVAVEVKRTAMIGAVGQCQRYVEALREEYPNSNVRGIIASLDVRPRTILLADKRGVGWVTLPSIWRV